MRVAYAEPSDKVVNLLNEIGTEVRHVEACAQDIVGDIDVPGIDRVSREAEYPMLIKTRPNQQWSVSRELRRRIKECFERNNVQDAGPGRTYVLDEPVAKSS